jgi:hypothetical protein
LHVRHSPGLWDESPECAPFLLFKYIIGDSFGTAGAWAKAVGVDCLALIACLLFPRQVSFTRAYSTVVLTGRRTLQVGIRDVEEQFNGAILAGDDLSIRVSNVYRHFLLCRFPVCTLDVSWRCFPRGTVSKLITF